MKPKPHKHNAGCDDHFCFHGAFRLKSDAVKKEQSTPGAFIKSLNYPPYSISDQRYAVLTRRKANPEMPGPPAHMKLGRHDLRRYNQAREWMEDHRQEYPSAQALAQEAAAKYGLQVKDLLPAAKAAKNPFFTRRQKRKMKQATRHALRSGVLRLFGIKQRKFKFGTRKSRAAQPSTHRRSSPSSG